MRKVVVEVKAKLVIEIDDDVQIGNVISKMDSSITYDLDGATVVDTAIMDYDVKREFNA